MAQANQHRPSYQCYPYLSKEEFAEACHHLENKYCQATLGPLRKQWKLNVHTALDVSFGADSEYTTFLQITRSLDDTADLCDLGSQLGNFSLDEGTGRLSSANETMMEIEELDHEVLLRQPPRPSFGHVKYEIYLHPTYRAPCLWFSLHDLPGDEAAFDIDTVFRRLVPDQYKDTLRGTSPIGGISADHHPVTGVPSFFVHPCFLGDAMTAFDCPKEDYLMVWLGLVGGCVGLWVPTEMALDR